MSGVRKTHIVYEANLNYKIAQGYLEILKDKGLIKQENGFVTTTEKGKVFREIAEELRL